ncbi:porin PorA family protein, partial [Nocardia rhizosphaerihabitans]|uniref:porin PorA family protein n=1 Tax=Nocardia rhizosphaerihabitans TaxID=1691570 RepID=UPI00366BD3C5
YTNTRDLWVEPRTGAVLKGGESIHLYYGRSADQIDVTALKSHIAFDSETIDAQLVVTQKSLAKLSLLGKTLPIILGILAVILLIAGAALGVLSSGGRAGSSASVSEELRRVPWPPPVT